MPQAHASAGAAAPNATTTSRSARAAGTHGIVSDGLRLRAAMRALLLCVAVSAASLLMQRTTAFDPTAWLIWGRQVADGTLHTLGGPSWKPLPVAFTALFAPAGDTVAPWLWLVVARTGGLVALVLTFPPTERLPRPPAGPRAPPPPPPPP